MSPRESPAAQAQVLAQEAARVIRRYPEGVRAAYIERLGGADEIVYGELPRPTLAPGEVLVRVEAVAVNPVDTFIRSGAYPTRLPFPFIVGRDLVGTVEEVAADAPGFTVGDRVWANSLGHEGRQGACAEYVAVDHERLYRLPAGIGAVEAVAALHPAGTAFTGLLDHVGGLHPGQAIFVGGAAGNVGSAVVQVAASMGARVFGSAHGEADRQWCRDLGCEDVFDYADSDLPMALRARVPDGVDVHWDTSGRHDLDQAAAMLAIGGVVVLMAGREARPVLPVGAFYLRNARLVGFVISRATIPQLAAAARGINHLLAQGRLAVRVARVMPLSQTAEAHRLLEGAAPGGRVRGRIVLHPDALQI